MQITNNGEGRSTVLIVDDTPEIIGILSSLLRGTYRTQAATCGSQALEIGASSDPPDIILLDVSMPGMSGYDVCQKLKENSKAAEIPVIFLSAKSTIEDEQKGFAMGAVDYITKPISSPVVLARVKTHLQNKATKDFLRDKAVLLENEVARRTKEISAVQDAAMVAMASLAETRDDETGNHLKRIQLGMEILAPWMKKRRRFKATLSAESIWLLPKSAALHDIGKVGIPDSILLKPGPLTPAEFEVMKTHTTLGGEALRAAEKILDSPASFLRFAREIALFHHERWDGEGYPQGLAGERIPVSARLMAVLDVFDALTSKRVYKQAIPYEEAVSIIRNTSGTHFDPDVVDGFLEVASDIRDNVMRFSDDDQ